MPRLGVTRFEEGLLDEMSPGPPLLAALGCSSPASAEVTTAHEDAITAAMVLFGGQIGTDEDRDMLYRPVAAILLARGMLADEKCGPKREAALATRVSAALDVRLGPRDDPDRSLIVQALESERKSYGEGHWNVA